MNVKAQFDLTGRVGIITGGAGLLGIRHAEAIAEMGGIPILVDVNAERVAVAAKQLATQYRVDAAGFEVDITNLAAVQDLDEALLRRYGRIDILINNAARNPKRENPGSDVWSRLENYPLDEWEEDLAVGLTGAFICSRVFGLSMANAGRGVILNIGSDLSIIAPDQRIYRRQYLPEEQQPVKPVSYSVVKHGLIGLTKYLATYWADQGVRSNTLSPGGVFNHQDDEFVQRLTSLIPLGRMAMPDEYKAAVVFLVSDASAYLNGANLVIDGGRTVW